MDEQPTAYDVDKVAEQLEELAKRYDSSDFGMVELVPYNPIRNTMQTKDSAERGTKPRAFLLLKRRRLWRRKI